MKITGITDPQKIKDLVDGSYTEMRDNEILVPSQEEERNDDFDFER